MSDVKARQFHGTWVCEPGDWEEVDRIRIAIAEEAITVTYYYHNGAEESEYHQYKVLSDRNGIVYIGHAPFSFLELAATDRMIISRMSDGKRRAFTYWFASEHKPGATSHDLQIPQRKNLGVWDIQ